MITTPYTIDQAISFSVQHLQALENPALEAELLLAAVMQLPRAFLYAYPEKTLTSLQQDQWRQLLTRRAQGEPMAYLLGKKEFWSLSLTVTPDTLIPRPETEGLVEIALAQLDANSVQQVADLGTGCGAIALALASARPHWQLTAVDQSLAALRSPHWDREPARSETRALLHRD